ncbi:YceI family protein [Hyunsoonleella aestuarii]|nr:YceI family protein [Hyunsoonleella aestuarii]
MNRFVAYIMILLMFSFNDYSDIRETLVVITPSSKVEIKGKTNINKFNCYFDCSNIKNPIPISYQFNDTNMLFHNTKLILQNSCFDCRNNGMNKDFYNLLNSDIHPSIMMELVSVKKQDLNTNFNALVNIELSGVKKSYYIPVIIEKNESISINGSIKLNICDFNLDPPTKALGLIVVDEEIEIILQLEVKEQIN